MKPNALTTWRKFESRFDEIKDKIAFWLFQMPPNFLATPENIGTISNFFSVLNMRNSAVIEFRHLSWWNKKDAVKETGSAFCSVDAPGLPREMVSLNDAIYVRLHGRETWYAYVYSEGELKQIIEAIKNYEVRKKYIYLNNDHGMLPNGKFLMQNV